MIKLIFYSVMLAVCAVLLVSIIGTVTVALAVGGGPLLGLGALVALLVQVWICGKR